MCAVEMAHDQAIEYVKFGKAMAKAGHPRCFLGSLQTRQRAGDGALAYLQHERRRLDVQLDAAPGTPESAYSAASGEQDIQSDSPKAIAARIVVTKITLSYGPE